LKLLIIITDLGSFNNFLSELANFYCDLKNNELHVICSRKKIINIADKYNLSDKKIHFHFIEIGRGLNLFNLLYSSYKIRKKIFEIDPQLIHVHFTTATFPTILFKINKYKYWSTLHGLGMNSTSGIRKLLFTVIEYLSIIRVDKVLVINQEDYNLLKKHFPQKTYKHKSLGIGCDIAKFNPTKFSELNKNKLREKYNINHDTIVIAFTGRFVYFKGFDLVIKTFQDLTIKFPNKYKLLLIGDLDPVHSTGLSEYDKNYFKNSKEIIRTGFVKNVELYLSITNIFFFPSKKEGLPTCIIESLSMGIPVITFNTRGNNDVIVENFNGILINPGKNKTIDVENFSLNIQKISFDKILYKKLSDNALNNRESYSRNIFINETLELYSNFEKFKI
jgi:glycosyltransferase involved in cell wall biosynthesis